MNDKTVDKFDYEGAMASLREPTKLANNLAITLSEMSALAHSSSRHAGDLETLLEIHDRASRKAGLAQQSAESISEYLALVSRRLIVAANNAELKRSRVHRLFSGRDFSHVDLSGLKLKNLDFTRCNLSHATMRKMSADQCQFERAWMSSVDARGAWFKHCDFGQTLTWRMYNFEGAEFQSCEFFRSDFSLRASGLTGVLFKHCTMPNGDHVHGYVRLLGRDKRDYELMALQRLDGEFNVWAGCQKFRTIDEAVAHWGAEDYHGGKKQGRWFVKRLEKLRTNPLFHGLPQGAEFVAPPDAPQSAGVRVDEAPYHAVSTSQPLYAQVTVDQAD